MVFDGRLDDQRRLTLDFLQVIEIPWIPGPRCRDAELLRQAVCISFVPRPLDSVPLRRRYPKNLCERRPVPGQSRDDFIASRIQHPSFESEPSSNVQDRFNCPRFIA